MIITCDKCSTRFNLDDSLVKENGSNVRCSVCKNMFTAYPVSREPEPEPEETAGLTLDNETDDDLVLDSGMDEDLSLDAPDEFDMDDSEFSINEPELEIETPELEIDDSGLDLDEPMLEMEDDDLDSVTEYTESEDSVLEMDTDFSFEESELEIQADADEDGQMEVSKLEFEDDNIEFDADDDGELDGLEFEEYKEDDEDSDSFDGISIEEDKGELTFDADDDDLDGLEFEEYKEDDSALDMEETQDQGLELEIGSTDDSKDMDTLADNLQPENEEEEFELEFDVEEETDSQTLEMETGSQEEDESSLTFDEDTAKEDEPPTITPEDDLAEYDEMQRLEIGAESDEQEETIEIDDTREDATFLQASKGDLQPPPVPGKQRRRKKKPLVSAPVLILLLIFFLIAGAYIASIMTGYKIPYLSDVKIPFIENLLKTSQPQKAASTLTLTEKKDWNGRFVDNETAGRLFIITGRIQNVSGAPLSHIKVKGILQTKANQVIKTKEVYCGNILSEETLKNANMETINKQLDIKDGRHKLNVNIKPGATVDYMIVFDNLSDDLDNFLVKAP